MFSVNYTKEGVDHIRINRYSESELGEILSYTYSKRFSIPSLGQFRSPICFANWLVTGDDRDRFNYKNLDMDKRPRNFKDYILYGKYWQIYSMRRFIAASPEIQLPFTDYTVDKNGNKVISKHVSYCFYMKDMIAHILNSDHNGKIPYNFSAELLKEIDARVKQTDKTKDTPVVTFNYEDSEEEVTVPDRPKKKKKYKKKKKVNLDHLEQTHAIVEEVVDDHVLCTVVKKDELPEPPEEITVNLETIGKGNENE